MTFGEKVRLARLAAKYSQKDLAKLAGIAPRTIMNYESGERIPKQRVTYTQLANALNIDEQILIDDNTEFVLKANETYGARASRKAEKLVEEVRGLYTGGELKDEDMDAMMRAIQDAYWIAKQINRKYVPLKYRKDEVE